MKTESTLILLGLVIAGSLALAAEKVDISKLDLTKRLIRAWIDQGAK